LGAVAVVSFESLAALVVIPARWAWRLAVRLRVALAILAVVALIAAAVLFAIHSLEPVIL
jgi:hypothetical protein